MTQVGKITHQKLEQGDEGDAPIFDALATDPQVSEDLAEALEESQTEGSEDADRAPRHRS
ncbi:hypothetical protein [Leucobacter tenebrionis]|uniref:hypothetical protein n=1 Tax=Leucobacter tenebrionis TaxID=2873270 RepID=UPI001CA60C9B|nr:hypothetical protein [Leucobacter tenebrionis]QZY52397.1 hypothetical protein KVY00_02715 [Leucobacter tenebrionis]